MTWHRHLNDTHPTLHPVECRWSSPASGLTKAQNQTKTEVEEWASIKLWSIVIQVYLIVTSNSTDNVTIWYNLPCDGNHWVWAEGLRMMHWRTGWGFYLCKTSSHDYVPQFHKVLSRTKQLLNTLSVHPVRIPYRLIQLPHLSFTNQNKKSSFSNLPIRTTVTNIYIHFNYCRQILFLGLPFSEISWWSCWYWSSPPLLSWPRFWERRRRAHVSFSKRRNMMAPRVRRHAAPWTR